MPRRRLGSRSTVCDATRSAVTRRADLAARAAGTPARILLRGQPCAPEVKGLYPGGCNAFSPAANLDAEAISLPQDALLKLLDVGIH